MPLLRETNQSLFPVDPYRFRPDLLDPGRYNPGEQARRFYASEGSSMSGMGFDIGGIIGAIGGLFGADPDKKAFDAYRQQLWEEFGRLTDAKDAARASGILTREMMADSIGQLQSIIQRHQSLYDQYRTKIEASWIDSRFNGYQSIYLDELPKWRLIYAQLPEPGIIDTVKDWLGLTTPIPDPMTGITAPVVPVAQAGISPLVVGGLILGLMFLTSQKGKMKRNNQGK